jgi:AmmeMemoRadiSam system protein B
MRLACAAGGFYPGRADELNQVLDDCFTHKLGPKGKSKPILGAVIPHAGFIYSGAAAAWVYHHLKANKQQTVVYLGPNHTGYGTAVSASSDDIWATPLGEVQVDVRMREKIAKACDEVVVEPMAHRFEHSIEVQLPFLQRIWDDPQIVPIALATTESTILKKLGDALSKLDCLILASSDLNHFLNQKLTNEKDNLAIEQVLKLDPAGLLKTVREKHISMCGVAAVATMLWALKGKAKKAELLKYYTSGDITGDMSSVVGYASIAIR